MWINLLSPPIVKVVHPNCIFILEEVTHSFNYRFWISSKKHTNSTTIYNKVKMNPCNFVRKFGWCLLQCKIANTSHLFNFNENWTALIYFWTIYIFVYVAIRVFVSDVSNLAFVWKITCSHYSLAWEVNQCRDINKESQVIKVRGLGCFNNISSKCDLL